MFIKDEIESRFFVSRDREIPTAPIDWDGAAKYFKQRLCLRELSGVSLPSLSIFPSTDGGHVISDRKGPVADKKDGGSDNRAISESPQFRARLKEAGVDVTKKGTIKIAVLEPVGTDHSKQVAGVINDEKLGLYPGARVDRIDHKQGVLNLRDYVDRKDGLLRYVSDMASGAIQDTTDELRSKFLKGDHKVINLSFGTSRSFLYKDLLNEFIKDPEKNRKFLEQLIGKEKSAEWIKHVQKQTAEKAKLDPKSKPDELSLRAQKAPHAKELMEKIVQRIDGILDRDPRFAKAMQDYQRVTKEAADKGIVIVVAAGNDHGMLDKYGVKSRADSYLSFQAMSEHVISVANINIGRTPADRRDDKVAPSSSPGFWPYLPTVGAHGEYVATPYSTLGMVGGTSFSAPLVAATVALMLEQNPSLKLPEIKHILQTTATRLDAAKEKQGAGVMNPDRAVIEARELRRRRAALPAR